MRQPTERSQAPADIVPSQKTLCQQNKEANSGLQTTEPHHQWIYSGESAALSP
uniref:Uncharacterized protein n=1 Tax=Anguilla anguilla TaxID=7936 RepID=A0A0E9RJE9_ANGAN